MIRHHSSNSTAHAIWRVASILFMVISSASIHAVEIESVEYSGLPLDLSVPTNSERLVRFPSPVIVDIPQDLDDKLETEIIDNKVFWKAERPFSRTRIKVKTMDQPPRWFILYLSGTDSAPSTPIQVQRRAEPIPSPSSSASVPEPIALSRWASQWVYAPKRLQKAFPGAVSTYVDKTPTLRLFYGAGIEVTPIAAWRTHRWHLTVVSIRNLTDQLIEWEPTSVRGHWYAATPQHGWLDPKGSETDQTYLYLVSKQPWGKSL